MESFLTIFVIALVWTIWRDKKKRVKKVRGIDAEYRQLVETHMRARENGIAIPVHSIGVPLEFIEHSKRNEILEQLGMTAQAIARDLVSWSSFTEEEKRFQREGSADHRPLH